MEFRYDVQFRPSGLPYVPKEAEAEISVNAGDEGVVISGNREGLLLLAKYLVSLAEFQAVPGYHFHLDPGQVLASESKPVTIYKFPTGR